MTTLTETKIALIEAVGTNQRWTFAIRGDDRQDIAGFQHRCRELEIPITLTKLHALTPIESETEAAFTGAEQEALVLAYKRGYFNTPRDVSMEYLGDERGISQRAVASRLRRGISSILGSTLSQTHPSE